MISFAAYHNGECSTKEMFAFFMNSETFVLVTSVNSATLDCNTAKLFLWCINVHSYTRCEETFPVYDIPLPFHLNGFQNHAMLL